MLEKALQIGVGLFYKVITDGSFLPVSIFVKNPCDILVLKHNSICETFLFFRIVLID